MNVKQLSRRGLLPRCLWAVAFFLCLLLAWRCAGTIETLYPSVSLRLGSGLTEAQAKSFGALLEEETAQYAVTFWWEEAGDAETAYTSADALAVRYCGTLRDVVQVELLDGAEPGALQDGAGLVSKGLALALWGSADVVGQEFTWNGETWVVSAVFQGEDSLLYLPAETAEGATCLELTGDIGDDPVGAANDFMALAGLDNWAGTVYGPQAAALLRLLNWLPLAVCGVWCLLALKRRYPIRRLALRRGLFWGIVLLAAALIPVGMAHLPGWLTPPQWSDFGFWVRLWQAAGKRLEDWFGIVPLTKDVNAKKALLCWAASWGGSLLCWSECRYLMLGTMEGSVDVFGRE